MVLASRFFMAVAILFAAVLSVCMSFTDVADADATLNARPNEGLWVEFDVNGERFRAVVTKPAAIEYVLGLVAGNEPQRVPIGELRAGPDHNSPWSWHLVPESIEFADVTMKICDGSPKDIEEKADEWINHIQRFCPWSAKITKVYDCRDGQCQELRGLYSGRSPAF